jgi:DNA-binding MarR family transcriptional regulator
MKEIFHNDDCAVILAAATVCDSRLTATDFRVLCLIAQRIGPSGWCDLPQRRLGEHLSLARESIARSAAQLEKLGFIERELVPGPPASKRMRIVMPRPVGS